MLGNLTALYVEDEDKIRSVVSSILELQFKRLFVATNGSEGLDIFKEKQDEIDIIITDINMPKMNGISMCTRIREINDIVPIIIITAHNDKNFLHQAIELGVSKFVTKPMNLKSLLEDIKKILKPIMLQEELEVQKRLNAQQLIENAKFKATSQLAAGITHEINTPLTYIKANFEMLGYDLEDIEDENIKKSIEKSVDKITDGLNRIENIVSSIKEISRASVEKFEDSNIYASVLTACTLAYNKIKHISNVYINGKLFTLDMDKNEFNLEANVQLQRIEQVWIIIVNNAMDELMKVPRFENRKLSINIHEDEEFIYTEFIDNAGGVKENVLPHIFDPFKGTKESSGMGIGLSIAKKIIDDHQQATIEVKNNEDGAIFKIKIKKGN